MEDCKESEEFKRFKESSEALTEIYNLRHNQIGQGSLKC